MQIEVSKQELKTIIRALKCGCSIDIVHHAAESQARIQNCNTEEEADAMVIKEQARLIKLKEDHDEQVLLLRARLTQAGNRASEHDEDETPVAAAADVI